jgi:hypothetical protein
MNKKLEVSQWRVLWFSPNAGLWQTSQLEHELANGLVQRGAQVTVVRCRGVFDSYCPTMQASLLDSGSPQSDKKAVCKSCLRDAAAFNSVALYSTIWLDDYLTQDMRTRVDLQIESVNTSNWKQIAIGTMPVGIHATYLSMLHHKVPDVTTTPASWNEYRSDLKNSLYAAESLPLIFTQIQPTHAVVYNPLYPTNRVFTELALKDSQIQYVGISASGFVRERYSTLALYRSIESSQTAVDSQTLEQSMTMPLSELEIDMVARQIGQLVQGSDPWVYSTPPTAKSIEEIKSALGLAGESSVAVVLIGSPDETRSSALVGAEFERVPIDQVSTVQEFIEQSLEAARRSPDINFVFRLHPRLTPNKRESIRSPDLDAIEALLATLPSNAVVNSSEDGIGLYDVARIASFGINHASSAGLELLALGIPVVHYDPQRLNAYPPTLGFEVPRLDQDSFQKVIKEAELKTVLSDEAVLAWRWYAVTLLRGVTHKSWTTTRAPDLQREEIPSLQWLRQLLPVKFRMRVSQIQSQNKRAKTIGTESFLTEPLPWIDECINRISGFDNSTIWNPQALVRGVSLDQESEKVRIKEEVEKVLDAIGKNKELDNQFEG